MLITFCRGVFRTLPHSLDDTFCKNYLRLLENLLLHWSPIFPSSYWDHYLHATWTDVLTIFSWCSVQNMKVFCMFSLGRVWTRTGSDKYAFITLTITVKSWCGGNLVRRRFKSYSECTEVCFNGHFRQWKSDLTDPTGNQT